MAAVSPIAGSDPGWPLVVYFHHVRADISHYTVLTPAEFALALDLLGRWFRPLDPAALGSAVVARPGEPTCLLTFDDGYSDVWEQALPLMDERGWRALNFVPTGWVGATEEHPDRGALRHMGWDELRELQARGHGVGSHGHLHHDLSRLDRDAVRAEVAMAGSVLNRELGLHTPPLAYPFGNEPEGLEYLADALPPLCFGSVKAPPASWAEQPRLIRRTYLPSGASERWPAMVEHWRREWERCVSR
jgi:peptidoglycan/xylan/chitin deacetylase (PgdA/CDA1 family)